jgi:hypothetical protein
MLSKNVNNKKYAPKFLFFNEKNQKDIGYRITESTGEKKSTSYLMQTIGMAIQHGNSSCILETVLDSKKLDEVYYSN